MFTSTADTKKSNWFSSLRRQPKAKKTALAAEKPTQKSCVDLTTSTLYSSDLSSQPPVDESVLLAPLSNPATERSICTCEWVKVTPSPSFSSDSPQSSASSASTTTASINTTVSRSLKENKYNPIQTASSVDNLTSDSANDLKDLVSLSALGDTSSLRRRPRRKEQIYTSTTVTTVTKTTVVNKQKTFRVGLIFSDNGELLNSSLDLRQLLEESKQAQQFIPACEGDTTSVSTAEVNNNIGKNLQCQRQFSILEDSNFDYIDDSADLFNRNYSGNNISSVHANSASSTPKVLRKCNNCKNKSNLVYRRSVSASHRTKQINDELNEVESEMRAHENKEENKHSNKDKQMALGRKKFNMDPKKGIEFLYENQLLRTDPQDVAQFLYKGEGLNKTAIGDYLGEKNDFNEQVLKAFVDLHDFTNLILVQALRQFLWSFRLPGEAQKIDRMMECFAQRYCQLNPDIFTNTDTCYVLSFAIIMLNTSLHNPSVKEKPTVEQFISMNRGINNGGDLPRELLESLYESIRTEPFKIPQDDGNDLMHTFFNPDKEGWLWKQGGRYKSWKRRWFILNDNCLYYFEYTTDKEPRGIIPLENIAVREVQDRSKQFCFELHASGGAEIIKACKTDSEGKVVEGKHTVYRMSAASEEEQQEWIKCLNQSISHNPFHDILVQRKKKALAKS
ncbi:cytohesin-1 isoform X1 [Wyeomyia smithii]|uniref:cytohesin-1 isoform X1 n=1 Tax=Wyeomyia smithii TaxID=174621 RepID=UPI0024680059|nr:cytohesin-1 isoform X1 [Wyeomyia smithii]XP_055539411.1 cytohesin-1 isoform X1 [Wyeomyia smithii]XP_055539412.1 cytohesin-1 isoform X1 [Wyeomyia smithii]XP_055539413.1 cytohesin-1 isoform X1 [Wyeomyia smithii]XP_055539414.1 cytohesin-1 isoform X1 [Wyeomyia smithii]XP_055539415.1 cytohesin-1 isoform X1 [Wyeomyia smithii]XP_055539416.1 cytohesin-1 isoform X1 [Wyeomyia smithii]XP_055539417.1 cytohesin-1 isoform X1 [Wyeomyia smithii]XP_055539418.1 cytohesin-1 isoform X1 [Wyeomyia smithii]XP